MLSQAARPGCVRGVRLIIYYTKRRFPEYSGFFWNLPALTQARCKAAQSGHTARCNN